MAIALNCFVLVFTGSPKRTPTGKDCVKQLTGYSDSNTKNIAGSATSTRKEREASKPCLFFLKGATIICVAVNRGDHAMPLFDFLKPRLETSVHIPDDEGDVCTCPNCLEASRREKERVKRPQDDHTLKPPIRYDLFQQ